MKLSKRSNEGVISINHKDSPGLSESIVGAMFPDLPLTAGRGMFEAPTYTCSHCQAVVILNPLRNRQRGHCPKCDHYVCDTCNLARITTGECKTYEQIIAEIQEAALKSESIKEI